MVRWKGGRDGGNRQGHKGVIACRIGSLQGCQNRAGMVARETDTEWYGAICQNFRAACR
jgi:hypothetical protein